MIPPPRPPCVPRPVTTVLRHLRLRLLTPGHWGYPGVQSLPGNSWRDGTYYFSAELSWALLPCWPEQESGLERPTLSQSQASSAQV